MISFETEKELVEQAMKRLDVILPARDSGTLLSHVLLSVSPTNVSITASDMESTVRIFIPAKAAQEGELIIRAKKLSEIATALKADHFVFKATEEDIHENDESAYENPEKRYQITIKGAEEGSAKYRMPGGFRAHFPEMSMISEDKLFKLPSALLLEMINKTFYSISHEENRYIYSGLNIRSDKDQLTMVGTDGRRLSAVTRKIAQPIELVGENEEDDIVVYSKAVKELKNLLLAEETENEVQVGIEQRNIFFRVGDAELSSRLLEGKFPDYEKVIPQEKNISIRLERRALLHAFEEVMVMTEEPARQVRMSLRKGRLIFEANTADIGESEKTIPLEYEGDDVNVCFNGSYVQDILRNIKPTDVLISIENENKPVMIHDPDDPDFISLVMPMRT